MTKFIQVFLVCIAVFLGTCLMADKVEAADKLVWTTTNLYYELNDDGSPKDILVMEGYFTNYTDRYINYIYEFNLTATIRADIGAGYTGKVKGKFSNFEKMIEPHSDSYHKFRLRNAQIIWPVEEFEVIQGYTKWKHSDAAG